MAQVRETIELLTKLLRGNGTSKIKAEIFRLAKFNNDEAVSNFVIECTRSRNIAGRNYSSIFSRNTHEISVHNDRSRIIFPHM